LTVNSVISEENVLSGGTISYRYTLESVDPLTPTVAIWVQL